MKIELESRFDIGEKIKYQIYDCFVAVQKGKRELGTKIGVIESIAFFINSEGVIATNYMTNYEDIVNAEQILEVL